MARAVRLIHYSDGTTSTKVVEAPPESVTGSDLAKARNMYFQRTHKYISLRQAASHIGVTAVKLSQFEHSGAGLTADQIRRLRVLYGV